MPYPIMAVKGHPVRQVTVALSSCDGSLLKSQPNAPRGCGGKMVIRGWQRKALLEVRDAVMSNDHEAQRCHFDDVTHTYTHTHTHTHTHMLYTFHKW